MVTVNSPRAWKVLLAQSKSSISLVDRKLQTSPVNKEKEPRDTTFPTSQVAQISEKEVLGKSPEGRGPAQPLRRTTRSFPRGKYSEMVRCIPEVVEGSTAPAALAPGRQAPQTRSGPNPPRWICWEDPTLWPKARRGLDAGKHAADCTGPGLICISQSQRPLSHQEKAAHAVPKRELRNRCPIGPQHRTGVLH